MVMIRTLIMAGIGVMVSLGAPVFAQLARDAAIDRTETLLKNLQDGSTAAIIKELDTKLNQALPEDKLQAVWPGLLTQFGVFKGITERREGLMEKRQAVELFLAFEKETVMMRAVFDSEQKIAGLVFRPVGMSVLPPNR
jgi:hypothetical protein